MKNGWIRFGCFLTGYNYHIVRITSEASAKAVKKYTSAMLIVCLLWAFVGFTFTDRYLKAELLGSVIGGLLMMIVIIQIERQIILTTGLKKWWSGVVIARVVIALVMAMLGSVIIDQIIFAEDIEREKIRTIDREVNEIMPLKTAELQAQIADISSTLADKETERMNVIDEVTKNPTIKLPASEVKYIPQVRKEQKLVNGELREVSRDTMVKEVSYTNQSIANPKAELVSRIDEQIRQLTDLRTEKQEAMLHLRQDLESELRENRGFLDELKVMFSLLSQSGVALFVWILWFTFFLGIELFVLFSKLGDGLTDYDQTVIHQMNMSLRKLNELSRSEGLAGAPPMDPAIPKA